MHLETSYCISSTTNLIYHGSDFKKRLIPVIIRILDITDVQMISHLFVYSIFHTCKSICIIYLYTLIWALEYMYYHTVTFDI